jgi:hypothetical protein
MPPCARTEPALLDEDLDIPGLAPARAAALAT